MTRKSKRAKPEPDEPAADQPTADQPAADLPAADMPAAGTPAVDIVGTWIRQEPDAAPYPDEITFDSDGIYSGKNAPGSAVASKLDVGVFDRIDETSIRMSTATDRNETFGLDVSEDDLKLVDEEGKELSYKRKSDDVASAAFEPAEVDEADAAEGADEAATGGSSNEEWKP
jgi:hypothetical protein